MIGFCFILRMQVFKKEYSYFPVGESGDEGKRDFHFGRSVNIIYVYTYICTLCVLSSLATYPNPLLRSNLIPVQIDYSVMLEFRDVVCLSVPTRTEASNLMTSVKYVRHGLCLYSLKCHGAVGENGRSDGYGKEK